MHIAHKAFAIGLLTGALLGSFGREAAAHGDASWIMENPETRVCCGPQDCGPLRIYDGTAEEISTGEWQSQSHPERIRLSLAAIPAYSAKASAAPTRASGLSPMSAHTAGRFDASLPSRWGSDDRSARRRHPDATRRQLPVPQRIEQGRVKPPRRLPVAD
jgi:hypothetical protein